MGWFRSLLTPQEHPSDAQRRELRELRDRVDSLETTANQLRKEWAAEQLAMADLIAKMNQWVGRLAARERRKAEKELAAADPDAPVPVQHELPVNPRNMTKAELRQLAARMRQPNGAHQ